MRHKRSTPNRSNRVNDQIQRDVAELIRHTAADIHPPFYYLLLHFWALFTGWSEFSAAWLSLLFGVLLIALVYRVGRALWRLIRLHQPALNQ